MFVNATNMGESVRLTNSRNGGARRRVPRRRSWMTLSPAALALSAIAAASTASAFQLSMVATHGVRGVPARLRSRTPSAPAAPSSGGVTSSLVSNLASAALKNRLADQAGVKCDVSGSPSDLLLRGTVGPVTVRGRAWSSRLGLTCRAIEATVNECRLDMGAVVSRQKLVLTTPAKGDALIALNEDDFANFIKHPLIKPPALPSGESFLFLKNEVRIDSSDGGAVIFYGEYMERRWKCVLRRGGQKNGGKGALVSVVPASEGAADHSAISSQLTEVISDFFNEMVFNLDGTFLSFKDMMVTDKGDSASVLLALSITVKKFPSPGLAF